MSLRVGLLEIINISAAAELTLYVVKGNTIAYFYIKLIPCELF